MPRRQRAETKYSAKVLYGLPGVEDVEFSVNAAPHDLDKIRHWVCATLSTKGGLRAPGVDARIDLPSGVSTIYAYIYTPDQTRPIGLVAIDEMEEQDS